MEHVRDSTGVGEICKEARIRSDLSRSDFAKLTGFSRSVIYRFEIGQNDNTMIFLSYYKILNKDDWKRIFQEVNRQNAYSARLSANGRGRDIKPKKQSNPENSGGC